MKVEGNLLKMATRYQGDGVDYYLTLGEEQVYVNEWIGRRLTLRYGHQINCIRCGRKTSKSFFQGYCYPCFVGAPETEPCVIHPEKCQAHEGISRDMEWSKRHCLIDHYVYLAVSSGLKVGVTRHTQIPTRWIDQGASRAVRLARTPNRYLAGLIEVDLKQHLADKTNWQRMLKGQLERQVDLKEEKQKASALLREDLREYLIDEDALTTIRYPLESHPLKVKSLSFDKVEQYTGTLVGIKGQYLIFDTGQVFNVRKHNGYLVRIETD
jgi:hypothetical protein